MIPKEVSQSIQLLKNTVLTVVILGAASNTINNISSSTTYSLRIKSANGCMSQIVYIYISESKLPVPDYDVTNPSCGNIGSIKFNTVADFYSIDNGANWSSNPVFSPLKEGYYYLLIKNKKWMYI